MIDIKNRLKSVSDTRQWAARRGDFMAKVAATKLVWFPPKPVETTAKGRQEVDRCCEEGNRYCQAGDQRRRQGNERGREEDNRCCEEDNRCCEEDLKLRVAVVLMSLT